MRKIPSWAKSIEHTAIVDALQNAYPTSWCKLYTESPKLASDNARVSYYQNAEKKNRNIRTVTSVGKYIRRHFPKLSDVQVRTIDSRYTPENFRYIENIDDIVNAVIKGPRSCMAHNHFDVHPYRVYDPKFGWKLAVRESDGIIKGRALVCNNVFVRSYSKNEKYPDQYGGNDNKLETWLSDQGITHADGWKYGTRLARIEARRGVVGPYIDGCNDQLTDMGDYLKFTSNGDFEGTNQSGYFEEYSACTCEDCGDRMSEDDGVWLGERIEGHVCQYCADHNYTYISEVRVNGRYIGGYYVRNEDTIETVEGESYPDDCYSDFDIVELANGDYTHIDNAVRCEVTDDYYHTDDIGEEIFYCEDTGDYRACDYWKCEVSGNYYSDDVDSIELKDGTIAHPDNVKDTATIDMFAE